MGGNESQTKSQINEKLWSVSGDGQRNHSCPSMHHLTSLNPNCFELNMDLPVKVDIHFVFFGSVTLQNLLIFVYSFQNCRIKIVTLRISISCVLHNIFPDQIFGAAATQSFLRFSPAIKVLGKQQLEGVIFHRGLINLQFLFSCKM